MQAVLGFETVSDEADTFREGTYGQIFRTGDRQSASWERYEPKPLYFYEYRWIGGSEVSENKK